jgi:crotonobetainyl-CoA:carnitine CoA-transferase CaiB-like acyl-CoA transferase
MANQAFSHLKVLELAEGIAGPYCAKLLAGFGAQVIKVERPGTGDRTRKIGPYCQNQPGVERSIPFLWLNTGKKSVTLDTETPGDREAMEQLIREVDVLVMDWQPGPTMDHGAEYERLRSRNPGLIMTSISNFGLTGLYRHYQADEITHYAMGGLMYVTGDPERSPLMSRPAICQYSAGMHAYIATLVALFRRAETGLGEHIDLSIHESSLENIELILAEQLHAGKTARRKNDEHVLVPWQVYPCQDGYAAIVGGPMRNWLKAVDLFEEPKLFDAKYRGMDGRMQHRPEVAALMRPWLSTHTKEEIYRAGQARGLAFGALATLEETLRSAQLAAREFFVAVDHPVVGRHPYAGAPFRSAEMSWQSERAPLLGEHNEAILGRIRCKAPSAERGSPGVTTGPTPAAARPTPVTAQPLGGIRIIDLTHDWAGPHATRLLADLGAEVIKVEYCRRLDAMRGGRKENQAYNHHPRWHHINRNKRSITLDLRKPRDLQIFKDLVGKADVVVENSRVGVLKRLGAGYEALQDLRPDLIFLSMSAFGQTGPDALNAGYGGTIEAAAGIQSLTAYDAASKPMRIKEMDVTNGILGACALLTALVHRQRTGRGQWIDLSEQEAALTGLVGELLLEHTVNGTRLEPMGNRHARYAPHGCYRCRGEDQWVTIAVRSQTEWQRLCAVIAPELETDARFITEANRGKNQVALDGIIENWTKGKTHIEAMHELQTAGIAAGAVLSADELHRDPHLLARGYFQETQDGSGRLYPGMPFRLSGGGGVVWRRGPDLGEDNEFVSCKILRRNKDEIDFPQETTIGTAFDIDQD